MNIPTKKLDSGFEIPIYGLGTWQMGGRNEKDTTNDASDIMAIQRAIEAGITHIDTAESYGDGHSEELVAEATTGYDRSQLFFASKVSANHQNYDDLLRSFENSLKRLKTDYLDLYMLHRYPEPGIDIIATMRAMDYLVNQGVVKNVGVCNMSINRFKKVQSLTKNKLVCNQLHYSLECREIVEREVLDYCQQNYVMAVAWGPLSKGALEKADILEGLAQKYDKTPYQIALNWLINQKNVVTISKTSQLHHLQENLGALGWSLDTDDQQKLTQNFPNQTNLSDRVPLDYVADIPV